MRSQSASRSTLPTSHGRGAETRAELGALAPDHGLVGVGVEALLEREGQPLGLARDELALLSAALEMGRERRERAAQAAGGGDRERREVGGAHARARARIAEGGGQRGAVPLHVDEIRARPGAAVALARPLDLAREPDQVGHADARAEPLGGDVLELVRLVEDHDVVLGEHPDAAVGRDPQPEVREIQRVVHEHDLGLAGERPAPARSSRSTAPGSGAPRQWSGPTVSWDQSPAGGATSSSARSPVCVLASQGREPLERRRVIRVDQALLDVVRGEPADVVATALEHDGVDRAAERRLRERQVVVQQLRLQRARRGRDDDGASGGRGRDQVGEALAHARAGLAEQRSAVLEGVRDRVRHASAAPPARENRAMRVRADRRPRESQSGTPGRTVTFGPVVPHAAHLGAATASRARNQ